MTAISFHINEPKEHVGREYEVSLFHQPDHLLLQKNSGWKSFYAIHEKSRTLVAEVHFHSDRLTAASPFRAPFGSYAYSESLPLEVLYNFILFVEEELKKDKVSNLILKLPPTKYFPEYHNALVPVLINLNYTIQQAEISSGIEISENPFSDLIDSWEKRKIKQAREAELVSRLIHAENLEMVYSFILQCRQQKEYSLSMTLEEVKTVVQKFPDRFILFGVFDQDNLAAAAIAIRVTDQVLYNFYSDHQARYDNLSPIVMLTESEYEYCQGHKLGMLDLGTSSIDGKLNFPLLDFKRRLGGRPIPKYTFVKKI